MSWWEAALLGLVQGLTEFLPVSSSGHLVLGQYLLGLQEAVLNDVSFEVFVHFGTVLSIITVYHRTLHGLVRETWQTLRNPATIPEAYRANEAFRTVVYILLTMIPTGLVYWMWKDALEATFGHPRLAAGMLIVTGVLLLLTRFRPHPTGDLTPVKSLIIGVAQALAMIPGISRSGATICTAIYQNVEREKAAHFSFLMLLPVVLGATVLKALDMVTHESAVGWIPLLIGTLVAYLSGVWAIRVVLRFVKQGRLQYFAYYCFIIGILGLLLI